MVTFAFRTITQVSTEDADHRGSQRPSVMKE